MKLYYDKKSKDPTYFIQKGFRNGKKTTTKNIVRIGKHSELLKITDDPLSYAKKQVKKHNESEEKDKSILEVCVNLAEKIKASNNIVSSSTHLNIGYLFLQKIYNELKIGDFFKNVTKDCKITFNPDTVNKFLTYSRILEPDSKLGTYENLNKYYEQPKFDYVHIMRTMDIMQKNYDEYMEHLFKHSNNIVKRNTSVCYYDCSNYYFETETNDEDYIDEVTGELVKGLRKYGVSKEHRPNPIVEMGLFVDSDGIPLSMCIVPGSDNEQTTALPLEEKLTKMFEGKKFIYCADAGLGSYNIRKFNSMGGRAFVVTQSIKKLSDVLKEAVFNDCDYRLLSNDTPANLEYMQTFDKQDDKNRTFYNDKIYKVISADIVVDLGLYEEKASRNGKTKKIKANGILPQKVIVTFSRKMMEYQRFIRNKQIDRAKQLIDKFNIDDYKRSPNDVKRFIKRISVTKSCEKKKDTYTLNQSVIDEEEKYDGFYAIATNLDDDAKTIININSERYKIEDCFRIMKTNFSARPVYHQTKERITAHFMICYTALLIFRLLETKLNRENQHFTTQNIIDTLKNMGVVNVKDMFYLSTYENSRVCTALNTIFNTDTDKQYYLPKDLNKKFKKI